MFVDTSTAGNATFHRSMFTLHSNHSVEDTHVSLPNFKLVLHEWYIHIFHLLIFTPGSGYNYRRLLRTSATIITSSPSILPSSSTTNHLLLFIKTSIPATRSQSLHDAHPRLPDPLPRPPPAKPRPRRVQMHCQRRCERRCLHMLQHGLRMGSPSRGHNMHVGPRQNIRAHTHWTWSWRPLSCLLRPRV